MLKKLLSLRALIIALAVSGAGLLVRGAWMIYPPAAYLLSGLLLLCIAFGLVSYAPNK
ncbi:MAG TPA: hypothetical protein VGM43_22925 [Bryobacteraceae bacterium]|jgi:hypothetical protein